MRGTGFLAAALIAGAAFAAPASAATNFYSTFDDYAVSTDPLTGYGEAIAYSIDDWTAGPAGVRVQAGGIHGDPESPDNLIELDTTSNSFISRTLDPGVYTLTYSYSPRPGTPEASNVLRVSLGGDTDQISGDGVGLDNTDWRVFSTSFTITTATQLKFAASGTQDGLGVYVDDIELVGTALPVPEPGEWAMLAAGLGVIGAAASRRRV